MLSRFKLARPSFVSRADICVPNLNLFFTHVHVEPCCSRASLNKRLAPPEQCSWWGEALGVILFNVGRKGLVNL